MSEVQTYDELTDPVCDMCDTPMWIASMSQTPFHGLRTYECPRCGRKSIEMVVAAED